MALLGYLATIGLVLGGVQGCCLPPKWEASVGLVEGYAGSGGSKRGSLSGIEYLHYDAVGRRIAAEANIYNNGVPSYTKVIQDYTKRTQYTIRNGTCMTSPLQNFPAGCFDTSKGFPYYIGGPSYHLPVQSVMVNKGNTQYSITLTADNSYRCVYVGVLQSGVEKGVGYMLTEGFMNTTMGIKNPSVFNVPSICRKKTMGNHIYTLKSALSVLGL